MKYDQAIKYIREKRGISQVSLAAKIDRSPSYISHIEKGNRDPSMEVLNELSFALKAPVSLITLLATEKEDVRNSAVYNEIKKAADAMLELSDIK